MTRYAVTGDVLCATADMGEPTGEQNGYPTYQWTNDNGTWWMGATAIISGITRVYVITSAPLVAGTPAWARVSGTEIGNYNPINGASNTATVAEYVAPTPDEYITVRWRASDEFTVLKVR